MTIALVPKQLQILLQPSGFQPVYHEHPLRVTRISIFFLSKVIPSIL